MAKSKRQRQRATQQAVARTTTTTIEPRRTGGSAPQRQSITAAAQQAQRRKEMMKWLGTGLLLVAFAVVAVIAIQQSRDDNGSGRDVAAVVAPTPIPEGVPQNGNVLGDPNAPVLIVEYGDYQCPFCGKFATEDFPKLVQDYIATGKARVEYRQFPVIASRGGQFDQDSESFLAAEAAVCAQDQGKFWPMHDALYANAVGENAGSFSLDRLMKIAALVPGLDTTALESCLAKGTHTNTVLEQASQATTSGVNSTPTFVVGDQIVQGADYERLKSVIDDQLAGN